MGKNGLYLAHLNSFIREGLKKSGIFQVQWVGGFEKVNSLDFKKKKNIQLLALIAIPHNSQADLGVP